MSAKPPPRRRSDGATRAEEKLRAFHEESAMGKAYDTRLILRLWPFVRPHSKFLVASLAMLAVLTAINLVRPLLMLLKRGEPPERE